MRILSFILLFLPFILFADPIEDMDEDEASSATLVLEGSYILDYCDCCDNAPARLIYAEKVTRETCSYNSEKYSVRVEGPIIAVFQVDEWGKLKPGAQAGKGRFSEVVSKNYTFVYFGGKGINLGRRLYTFFDFCQGFIQFPTPALLPAPNAAFADWYKIEELNTGTPPNGAWQLDRICSAYGDCQPIPGSEPPLWRIEGGKLTVVNGDSRTGNIAFSQDMMGSVTINGIQEKFAWFLAPDNTLIIKQIKKSERSFMQFSLITRYVTAVSGLRLRSAPTLDAPVTATIPYGTAVELQPATSDEPFFATVEDFEGQMLYAKAGDQLGYMFSGFLSARPVAEAEVITTKMAVVQHPNTLEYAASAYNSSPINFNASIDDLAYYFSETVTALENAKVPFKVLDANLLEFRTAAGKKFVVNCEARGGNILIIFDGVNAPTIHSLLDLQSDTSILNKLKK